MYEHKTMTGRGLPSEAQLDVLAEEGWELITVIPYTEGMIEIEKGDVAIYLRRIKVVS